MRQFFPLLLIGLMLSSSVHAEWFLRGSHNGWGADQMESHGATMRAPNIDFQSGGQIKVDRWGDWSENYGQGGAGGGNVAVPAGVWTIEFVIDTKAINIVAPQTNTQYHLRGSFNSWAQGTIMTEVAGVTGQVESCQDFSNSTNPRFKVDPDGGWGGDEFPGADVSVSASWVRITVDTVNNSILSVEENLADNCAVATQDSDNDGVLDINDDCPNTPAGVVVDNRGCPLDSDGDGVPDFQDQCPNTPQGAAVDANGCELPPADSDNDGVIDDDDLCPNTPAGVVVDSQGCPLDSDGDGVADFEDQCPNTPAGATVDSVGCEVVISIEYHLRGSFNGWSEGTILTPVSGASLYETCVNFANGSGTPRFKIDPDGGWGGDEFPAEDYIVSGGWTRITVDSASDSIVSVEEDLGENCSEAQVGDDFRSEVVYFLFVDRFANGDPSNDDGNNPSATSALKHNSNDEGEWKKYWGGDIQGIIDNLDYLENMGITAIWVTPLNDAVDTGPETPYHGYWGRDFYEVDEHLGSWELVDQLSAELKARDMKFILDFALNHSNRASSQEFGTLWKEGEFVTNYNSDSQGFYNHNGAIADCGDNDPNTTCDEDWGNGWALLNKNLFDLADFKQGIDSNSVADQYLIDAAIKWMDHGVDAFRVDALKHIERNFIGRFSDAMKAHNPDVFIFGEWWDGGIKESASMQFLAEGYGCELLDFSFRDDLERAVGSAISMETLNDHVEARPGAMGGREDWQLIFLDNHDMTRTSVYLQANGTISNNRQGRGFSKTEADARQDIGNILVMTLPGIPIIYYGSEHHVTSFNVAKGQIGRDPFNREQMPSFDQSAPAYQMIKALAELRAVSPALVKGSYQEKWVNQDVLAFERKEGSDAVFVAVNVGDSRSITVNNLSLADGSYTNILGGETIVVSGGSATLTVPTRGSVVLH